MANYGLYNKPYIKMGTNQTECYCCIKDECQKTGRNVHDVAFDQRGKHEHKMVFYIRRSGQDTCICLDCFKKLYEDIIAQEIEKATPAQAPVETSNEAQTEEPKAGTKKTVNKAK